MAFNLKRFDNTDLDGEYIEWLVTEGAPGRRAWHERLWNYYRNPLIPAASAGRSASAHARPYVLAQEVGLPARITGVQRVGSGESLTDLHRKEVVIENDIAWRIQTMVDFLFGKGCRIRSLAGEPDLAGTIETTLEAMLAANGGQEFLQNLAVAGSVHGFVDIALRIPADWPAGALAAPPHTAGRPADRQRATASTDRPGSSSSDGKAGDVAALGSKHSLTRLRELARHLLLEIIEAPRVLPVLAENNYRHPLLWMQTFHKHPPRLEGRRQGWLRLPGRRNEQPANVEVVELIGPTWWQQYEDRQLVAEGPNTLGRIPIVHVQNLPATGSYAGLSDVEPLIPLQDELNTRLSDRANRVTYQSFKMYLGKGIDDFLDRPVGPGQMWSTQNLAASIEEFGHDDGSPSEDAHIEQVRQALDKVSGVTPLAAGLIGGNIGHLTSATALRVCLSGLLAKTTRKRLTYGAALANVAELALAWLDRTGVLATRPEDRRVEVVWPDPLPTDEAQQLANAKAKQDLGVPRARILAELGYSTQPTLTEE
jgi:hypothetical protein